MDLVTFDNFKSTMKAGLDLQTALLCLLIVGSGSPSFGQYISDRETDYLLENVAVSTVIPPFYQNLDEKTYYHSRQIHGMKKDLNSHAKNLSDLRIRFNQVFYGRKSAAGGTDPFLVGPRPQMPVHHEESAGIVYIPPSPKEPRVRNESPQSYVEVPEAGQTASGEEFTSDALLAFSVQEPGVFTSHDGRQIPPLPNTKSTEVGIKPRKFDYYIIPRISLAIPSQIEKNINHPQPHYKRYNVGVSGSLSSGLRLDRWRLGIAGILQQNELHPTSWAKESPVGPRFDRAGKTSSFAFMIEASHIIPVYSSLFMNFDLGFGYRFSKSSYEYSNSLSPTKYTSIDEDYFLWSIGTGFGWEFSEQVSLLLAYRYFDEETVPTHHLDLGFEFDF